MRPVTSRRTRASDCCSLDGRDAAPVLKVGDTASQKTCRNFDVQQGQALLLSHGAEKNAGSGLSGRAFEVPSGLVFQLWLVHRPIRAGIRESFQPPSITPVVENVEPLRCRANTRPPAKLFAGTSTRDTLGARKLLVWGPKVSGFASPAAFRVSRQFPRECGTCLTGARAAR